MESPGLWMIKTNSRIPETNSRDHWSHRIYCAMPECFLVWFRGLQKNLAQDRSVSATQWEKTHRQQCPIYSMFFSSHYWNTSGSLKGLLEICAYCINLQLVPKLKHHILKGELILAGYWIKITIGHTLNYSVSDEDRIRFIWEILLGKIVCHHSPFNLI